MAIGLPECLRCSLLVTIFIYFKFLATNVAWAMAKGKAGLRAAEDANNNAAGITDNQAKEAAEHAGRVVQNDMENIPFTLIFMWAGLLSLALSPAGDTEWKVQFAFSIIFCASRYLHSLFYFLRIAPPRSFAWVMNLAAAFAFLINATIAAWKIPLS